MKELREFIRYTVEPGSGKTAFVEIGSNGNLTGVVSDLSAGGFSFGIEINDKKNYEFELEKFIFIRLNYNRLSINAEVEKRWSLLKNADDKKIYTAGVSFKVISNEDRLILNEIIELLRSEPSTSRY